MDDNSIRSFVEILPSRASLIVFLRFLKPLMVTVSSLRVSTTSFSALYPVLLIVDDGLYLPIL